MSHKARNESSVRREENALSLFSTNSTKSRGKCNS